MEESPAPKLSAQELSSATGEPVERVRRLRSLKLIGSEGDERFAPEDIERIRLIQFLERQQIGLEMVARAEHEEALLASVVEFLFPNGVGRTYSFAQAIELVALDPGVARRLPFVVRSACACSWTRRRDIDRDTFSTCPNRGRHQSRPHPPVALARVAFGIRLEFPPR